MDKFLLYTAFAILGVVLLICAATTGFAIALALGVV